MWPTGGEGQERSCAASHSAGIGEGWGLAAPQPTANTHSRKEVLKHPHGAWATKNRWG